MKDLQKLFQGKSEKIMVKPCFKLVAALELHSRFSPTLSFQTDQHDGQQTDHMNLHHTHQHEPLLDGQT